MKASVLACVVLWQMQIDLWCEDPTLCLRSWLIMARVATIIWCYVKTSTCNGYVIFFIPLFILPLNQFVAWSARMIQVGYGWNAVWHILKSFSSYMVPECYQWHENSPYIPMIWVFASNCTVPQSLSFLIKCLEWHPSQPGRHLLLAVLRLAFVGGYISSNCQMRLSTRENQLVLNNIIKPLMF